MEVLISTKVAFPIPKEQEQATDFKILHPAWMEQITSTWKEDGSKWVVYSDVSEFEGMVKI